MITWVLKLTLAHLLGDFMLQPNKWIENKNRRTYKSKYLYYHIIIHFVLLLVVLEFDFKYWTALIIIPISHYVIDLGKLILRKKNRDKSFVFYRSSLAFFSDFFCN
jgi:cytochrome bd-type quinol oxidase subunit 2